MTIMVDGWPVLVDFVSKNNNVMIYRRADTKIQNGYLYNIYSCNLKYASYQHEVIQFHKKLKIYKSEWYGFYVICQGVRTYVNSLVNGGMKYE